VPDPAICEFVKEWNASYAWPRFVIAATSTAFRAFEQRYGASIPRVRGDWTPYWEDGAGSSALETGLNRTGSDRLTQAEALWAMRDPAGYPVSAFGARQAIDVYNTTSWPRTEVVLVPHGISEGGDRVRDDRGQPVVSQRLSAGELAVLVRDLKPFSGRRYRIIPGRPFHEGPSATVSGPVLENLRRRTTRLDADP